VIGIGAPARSAITVPNLKWEILPRICVDRRGSTRLRCLPGNGSFDE